MGRDAIRYPEHLQEHDNDLQEASIRHSMGLYMCARVQRAVLLSKLTETACAGSIVTACVQRGQRSKPSESRSHALITAFVPLLVDLGTAEVGLIELSSATPDLDVHAPHRPTFRLDIGNVIVYSETNL